MISQIGKDKNLVLSNSTIAEALIALNKSPHHTLFVIDGSKKILGVVTDGDIRTGFQAGFDATSAITDVMNPNFKYINAGQTVENIKVEDHVRVVPVIEDGKYVGPQAISSVSKVKVTEALIMAGGFGSRMGDLTRSTPKPMLNIHGKPIIQHTVENLVQQGVSKINISTHYLSEQIYRHFGDGAEFNCKISYLVEESPLGTGGALSLLSEMTCEDIFVTNGDLFTNINLQNLIDFHNFEKSSATLVIKRHEIKNPFGVVQLDGIRVSGFEEKPMHVSYVNAGMYMISRKTISGLRPNTKFDLPDFLLDLLAKGETVSAYPLVNELWWDIGNPTVLEELNK